VRTGIWVPIMMEEQLVAAGDLLHDLTIFWLLALARLKSGVAPERHRRKDAVD